MGRADPVYCGGHVNICTVPFYLQRLLGMEGKKQPKLTSRAVPLISE